MCNKTDVPRNSIFWIKRVFELQIQYPKKNDWASDCLTNLKQMDINMSLEEIRLIPENKFKNFVRQKKTRNVHLDICSKEGEVN